MGKDVRARAAHGIALRAILHEAVAKDGRKDRDGAATGAPGVGSLVSWVTEHDDGDYARVQRGGNLRRRGVHHVRSLAVAYQHELLVRACGRLRRDVRHCLRYPLCLAARCHSCWVRHVVHRHAWNQTARR